MRSNPVTPWRFPLRCTGIRVMEKGIPMIPQRMIAKMINLRKKYASRPRVSIMVVLQVLKTGVIQLSRPLVLVGAWAPLFDDLINVLGS